ncbi:MAG TPA: HesA/MoeB/ThiF family protein [Candidatus Hydrogenedentes bacterium]|nr:HesA/MoeB/ThiF family protein [Candidatus Hydrogenedentota bacterium]
MTSLTPDPQARYAAHLRIPGFGPEGQARARRAKVIVVGLGGLGSPAALYLAAAGVGKLGLLDADRVELSNLQRQVLHTTPRTGMSKVESAATALGALNPEVVLQRHATRLTEDNAASLLDPYDFIVEACDDFPAKYTINDTCLKLRKPFVTAGVARLTGQAMLVVPGQSPCLRCVVPEQPDAAPDARTAGILGPVAGLMGCMETVQALRYIAGLWSPEPDGAGMLHSLDGDTMRLRTLRTRRKRDCRCAECWSTP